MKFKRRIWKIWHELHKAKEDQKKEQMAQQNALKTSASKWSMHYQHNV
jgi:hypothetical protein